MASSTGSPTLRRPLSSARPNCRPRVTRPLWTSRQGMTRLASMKVRLKRGELADKLINLLGLRLTLDGAIHPHQYFGIGKKGHDIYFPAIAFLHEGQAQGRQRVLVFDLQIGTAS